MINAIRKEAADQEALLRLDHPEHLWMEKEITSVANVTCADVTEFLALAARARTSANTPSRMRTGPSPI